MQHKSALADPNRRKKFTPRGSTRVPPACQPVSRRKMSYKMDPRTAVLNMKVAFSNTQQATSETDRLCTPIAGIFFSSIEKLPAISIAAGANCTKGSCSNILPTKICPVRLSHIYHRCSMEARRRDQSHFCPPHSSATSLPPAFPHRT